MSFLDSLISRTKETHQQAADYKQKTHNDQYPHFYTN